MIKPIRALGTLIVVAVAVVLTGCSDLDSRTKQALKKFGPSMDDKRVELGILPIPANAVTQIAGNDRIRFAAVKGSHKTKVIRFKEDLSAPIEEIDFCMFSVNSGPPPPPNPDGSPNDDDLPQPESVTISVLYNDDGTAVKSWALLTSGRDGTGDIRKELSREEVDALLKKHGMR